MIHSLIRFLFAGFCEIGGGYLIWLWLKEGKSIWFAMGGAILLMLYGIAATLQPTTFGRAYAAYGGIFIALSLLWGWAIDGVKPDSLDWVGFSLTLLGVGVMMYFPRG